jgi:hypothetical protein
LHLHVQRIVLANLRTQLVVLLGQHRFQTGFSI